jgi:hypothetical protein
MSQTSRKRQNESRQAKGSKAPQISLKPVVISAVASAIIASLITTAALKQKQQASVSLPPSSANSTVDTIDSLLSRPTLPDSSDIAILNLACAPDINGKDQDVILKRHLDTIERWADHVREQTSRNYHHYLDDPKQFKNEADWKLGMMVTIIAQDFKLRYDPTLTSLKQQNSDNITFFAKPESVFLTGCLGESRYGTCASLPVLYVAIGRRLGYPMRLVMAKSHLFARWDDGQGTRINLEAANSGGYASHTDDYYRSWPFPLSPEEEKLGSYLTNLTSQQSLAIFLSIRATCFQVTRDNTSAIAAAAAAYRLAPDLGGIQQSLYHNVTSDHFNHPQAIDNISRQQDALNVYGIAPLPMPGNPSILPGHVPVTLPNQHINYPLIPNPNQPSIPQSQPFTTR